MAIWTKDNSKFEVKTRDGYLRGLTFNGQVLPIVLNLDDEEKFDPIDNTITVKLYAPNIIVTDFPTSED